MTRSLPRLLLACAGALALTSPALAQDCDRLVEAYTQHFGNRDRAPVSVSVPATGGEWFLVVTRNGNSLARIDFNGQRVLGSRSLTGRKSAVIPVSVQQSNTLEVRTNRSGVDVALVGVVPSSALPAGVGRPVVEMTLAQQSFAGSFGAPTQQVSVAAPGTEGLFLLRADNGPSRILVGSVGWNGSTLFGPSALNVGRSTTGESEVAAQANNQLTVRAFGFPGSQVTVAVRGFVIDEVAPTLSWDAPPAGSTPAPGDSLRVSYADALSGIQGSTLNITLNGADVTSAFTAGSGSASTTLAGLPAGSVQSGTNTLLATIQDKACNETQASVTFLSGTGGGPPAGPGVSHPTSLTVGAAGASTRVQFTVRANDPNDPNPTVSCSPAAGSVFPLGTTQVTCTATNAQGGQTVVTFPVTVVDTASPFLGQPGAVYAGPTARPTGVAPRALVVADLDGDGDLDVATANSQSDSISVYLNDGSGGLTNSVTLSSGAGPVALAAGDLTGDGVPELVSANAGGQSVTVFVNDGSGGFASGVDSGAGMASDVGVGDLNGDGTNDVVVATGAAVSLLAGDGSGNLATAVSYAAPGASRLALADLDRDGRLDVATSGVGGVTALLNDGSGLVAGAAQAAGASPRGVAAADLNGDGWPDLAVADGSGSVHVLLGSGAGAFASAVSTGAGAQPSSVTAADVDADGDLDLVLSGAGASALTVCLNDGAGNLTATAVAAGANTHAAAVGDLNGDGRPDLVGAGSDDTLRTLLGDPGVGVGNLEATSSAGATASYAVAVSDSVDPSPSLTTSPASGSTFPLGTTPVAVSASDASGNQSSLSFPVTVVDTTAPSLTVAADVTVEQTSPAGAVVTYTAPSATDLADPNPAVVCTPASGSTFPAGTSTVTCTATDAAGNTAQVTFAVTVVDTTAPALTTPVDLLVEQTGQVGSVVTYAAPTATDVADPSPAVVCSPASGSLFPAGVSTVTCTATDAAGNSSQVTFTVTVLDTVAPTLTQPADTTVEQTGPSGAVVTYAAPTASDVADPNPSVVCTPASGSTFAAGVTTVTCTATDTAGNTSQVTFTVTVQDTQGPTLSVVPSDGSGVPNGPLDLIANYSDPGSGVDTGSFLAFLDGSDISPMFGVSGSQATANVTLAAGSHSFEIRISDASGTQSVATSTFTVASPADTTPPNVSFASPVDGGCLAPSGVAHLDFSDAESGIDPIGPQIFLNGIDISSSFTVNLASGTAVASAAGLAGMAEGANVIWATIWDNGGNSSQQIVNFTFDSGAPSLALTPASGDTIDPAQQVLTATYGDAGCGIDVASVQVSLDGSDVTAAFTVGAGQATGSPSLGDGLHTWTVTVRDLAGNETQISATFTASSPAVTIEVTVSGDPANLPIAVAHDLTLRALTAAGTTASSFTGTVLISTSDSLLPLNGLVVDFTSLDQGVVSAAGLALFRTLGAVTVSAQSLAPPPDDISGALVLNVIVTGPVIFPDLPSAVPSGDLDVAGYSFPSVAVQLVIDGAVVDTTTAAVDGWFSFPTATLGQGSHDVLARAVDPGSALPVDSQTFVVSGPGPSLPRDEPQLTGAGQEPADGAGDAQAAAVYGPAKGNATGSSTVLSSGEKRLERVDMRIPGRGQIHFELRRRYRSQLDYDGPLGHGWDFSYNEALYVQPSGDVLRGDGLGRLALWTDAGGGAFSPPVGQFGTLRQEGDGSYTLREPNGFKHRYDSQGRLTSQQDRHGNALSFTYDGRGNLQRATDPYGRQVDFVYATFADGRDRLVTVRDFTGREVVYSYSANAYDLAEVRSPVVVGTSTGDNFPGGRTERYTYREGSGDPNLDHNLLTVTRPQEVADGGTATITISYGQSAGDSYDRVTSEVVGGVNASGVPAGGTVSYAYMAVNQAAGPDLALSRLDVTVTERNGNQFVSQVNERGHQITLRRLTRGLRAAEPASYETRFEYNADGLLTRETLPLGNELRYSYGSGPRAAQRNCVETRRVADAARGGSDLVVTRTFEPLFQQLASETDPRENDPGFSPPMGTNFPGRYTRRWSFDYQEGSGTVAEASDWGISLAGVTRALGDLNSDGATSQTAGNAVREDGPTVLVGAGSNMAAVLGDTSQEIVWERQWDDRGNLIAEIDPEGVITTSSYYPENDPDGDGSTVVGQSSTLGRGYLRARTVDAASTARRTSTRAPEALETAYGYDALGHKTLERDPRGVETRWEVNALGEVVVETRGADTAQAIVRGQLPTAEAPYLYETRRFHDHNGRLVRTEVEDDPLVSATSGVAGWVEQTFTYDILDQRVAATQEVDAGTTLTTTWGYDAHGLQISVVHPRGNEDAVSYDERHLAFRITEGAGSLEAGTFQLNYDANGNRASLTDAEDHDGDMLGESTVYAYDGHDRLVSTTTPMNTQTLLSLDPASNVTREQVFGHPGNQPGAANQLLRDRQFTVDELGRICQIDQPLFAVPGEARVRVFILPDFDMDGIVVDLIEHDALGRERFRVEDDDEVTETRYDGAGRVAEVIDFLGNAVATFYDANGNPIRLVVTETPDTLSGSFTPPTSVATTYYVYDQLNQLVRVSDPLGQTGTFGYDSRGNQTRTSDAEGPLMGLPDPLGVFPGMINEAGNTRSFSYDGADRRVEEVTDLRVGGLGGAPLDTSSASNTDGQITLGFGYDANGNLTSITDDNGGTTQFGFDARDRRVSRTLADGSTYTFGYDRDSNLSSSTDPNGSVVTYAYDSDNRRVQLDVARGPGVRGTTQQTFGYDGLGNLTSSTDDNTAPVLRVTRVYDSLGRMLEEVQGTSGLPVTHTYAGDGETKNTVYPWGKVAYWVYDDLDRVKNATSQESGFLQDVIVSIAYAGAGNHELERTLGNYTLIQHHDSVGNVTGWDAAGNETGFRLLGGIFGNEIYRRDYTYNRAGYRTSEKRWDDYEQRDSYAYDSAYRVVRTDLDREGIGFISRRDERTMDYEYDGVGNRSRVTRDTLSASPETTVYSVDGVNGYTQIGTATRTHDANGNLTGDGTRSYEFDFQNRLSRVVHVATAAELAIYAYDAGGRRVRRIFKDVNGTVIDDLEYFYDNDSRVIEQYDHVAAERQLNVVYGPKGSQEVVFQEVTATAYSGPRKVWYARNPRNDLLGVTDETGNLMLSFIYDDFGSAFLTFGTSPFPPYLFQGRRFDNETGHYVWRARYYDPGSGRFTSRDPGVYDATNAGNQYTYAGNAPTSRIEPNGRSADLQPAPLGPAQAVDALLDR